jgi:hypothetical protein
MSGRHSDNRASGQRHRFARNGVQRGRFTQTGTGRLRGLAVGVAVGIAVLLGTASSALAGVPDPGQGLAPPGSAQLLTILKYLSWGVSLACVAGVLIVAAKMAVAHGRGGGGGEHAASLGWVLGAAVIAGSASALIGAVI